MAVRSLKSFFPTADELLAADLPRLGEVLLVHVNSYEGRVKQHGWLNQGYLRAMLENRNVGLGPLPPAPEYGPRQPEVTRRVMEAWNWLERQGFLIPDASAHGWHLISTEGERLLEKLLAAISEGASVDPNAMGDHRSITIAGPDDTFLLIEPRGDRYQWRFRNDSLRDSKNLLLEITDARSFSPKHSAFRDPMGFRFPWPLVKELPSGHLSRGEVFLRFEGDKFGFGDTMGTYLLPWPNGDPSTTRRWLLSMIVVGLSRDWPIELQVQWTLGTKTLELMEHAQEPPDEPASPHHSNVHSLSDPFTFFKEPRPLGDNPYPAESSLWHAFEEETHVAKKRLDALWSDYLERYAPTDSHAEVLTLILEARLKRLDIIAECMLRVFVADTETGRLYEDWLADLMRAEEQNVLDLVQQEVPHYSGCFDHEKFALALQLRQQGYKERGDDRVIQLISQRRTASAAGGDAPSSSRPKAAASSLENAGFWRARRAEFDALLSRQREILKLETRDEWLKAYCDFSAEHGEFGRCRVQGGLDGRLISDFDDIATQAAKGLGCPPGVNPLTFWLYNLAQDLLRSSNPQIRHEFSPGGEWGGYIQGLLESSAGYCSRLAAIAERQANDGRLPSAQQQRDTSLKSEATKDLEKNAVEVAERATKRQEVVNQILQTKRWKRGRLATEAGVGKNSVYEYLDGTRAKITDENRKAIAQALDLKPEQLPD